MTMKITIEIELGNAAMRTADDVAWTLRDTAKALEEKPNTWDRVLAFPLLDSNGNNVGMFRVED